MPRSTLSCSVAHYLRTVVSVAFDLVRFAQAAARSRTAMAAENLFLRKQLALFQERKVRPRRADDSTRWVLATLSRLFPWRGALVNVKPDTRRCGSVAVGPRSRRTRKQSCRKPQRSAPRRHPKASQASMTRWTAQGRYRYHQITPLLRRKRRFFSISLHA
jgi:hypothetical protein